MIQRKQTIFLLLAVVAFVVCLALPVAMVVPEMLGQTMAVYNLGVVDANGSFNFSSVPLFVLLAVACVLSFVAIFLYHNRSLQARLCTTVLVLLSAWYAYYALCAFGVLLDLGTGSFHMSFAGMLPAVAMILLVLARKGVLDDEKLVRAADRLR